jgi:transcriptional regulator with XRE-family HTH domain
MTTLAPLRPKRKISSIGAAVKLIRSERNTTLSTVATRSGMKQEIIRLIEEGNEPSWSEIKGIAFGLGIKPSELVMYAETLEEQSDDMQSAISDIADLASALNGAEMEDLFNKAVIND